MLIIPQVMLEARADDISLKFTKVAKLESSATQGTLSFDTSASSYVHVDCLHCRFQRWQLWLADVLAPLRSVPI
jgi:hypothetical protein